MIPLYPRPQVDLVFLLTNANFYFLANCLGFPPHNQKKPHLATKNFPSDTTTTTKE